MNTESQQSIPATALLRIRSAVLAGAVGLAASILLFTSAHAESDETIIKAHGISAFGDLKYPEGFPHFDYVNPNAPRGGTFSTWAFGTFTA